MALVVGIGGGAGVTAATPADVGRAEAVLGWWDDPGGELGVSSEQAGDVLVVGGVDAVGAPAGLAPTAGLVAG